MKSFTVTAVSLMATFQAVSAAPAPEPQPQGGISVGGLIPASPSLPIATLTLNPNLPTSVNFPTSNNLPTSANFPTVGLTKAPIPTSCGRSPNCYTHTVTTIPKAGCPRPTDAKCPKQTKVTSVKVPCANGCCPATQTKTVTAGCPRSCVTPTSTVTFQSGCKATPW